MKNFGRALKLAISYRLTFVASLVCAVLVGALWGGNIGVVYPFVEVVAQGRTLHDWADQKIADAQATIDEQRQELAERQAVLAVAPEAERSQHQTEVRLAEIRIEAEEAALARYRRLQPIIEQYVPDDSFATLALIVGLLLVGTVIKSVFFIAHSILVARLAQLTAFDLRKQFFRKALELDQALYSKQGSSDLLSRFTHDLENAIAGVRLLLGKAVREPLKMIACLILAAWICWRLLLLSLIVAPLAAFLVTVLGKALKRANRRAMEGMSHIYGILEETFRGIKIVKAFTMERYERNRFHLASKKYYFKSMRIARYDALTHPLTEMMGVVTIGMALLAGAYLVLGGRTHLLGIRICDRPLDLGSLVLFYGFLAGTSDPARKLTDIFNRVQRAAAASDRVYALLDRAPQIRDAEHPRPLHRHHRELAFEGIEFHYAPGVPVLTGIDLRIQFGETVAIVGPNGCGKSTLVNLIPRFFDPTAGAVKLDGIDLREVRLRDLRRQIGLVTQETLLFDDTVYNNIRYGSPHATRDEVISAAQRAHAHRLITQVLEAGYETVVGPGGNQLSGGQRQRIALARAILRDPPVLILDEATSQVDLESEQVIQKVLEQFVRHRTTLIITHRLGILALADRILVMNAGRIVDFGTHDELQRRCELYARLYDIEFRERESA